MRNVTMSTLIIKIMLDWLIERLDCLAASVRISFHGNSRTNCKELLSASLQASAIISRA